MEKTRSRQPARVFRATLRARHTPWAVLAALLMLPALPATVRAATVQIDCDSTADFCTGDPCVTQDTLEITVPNCTLNFGSAALEIATQVRIPNGGTLSLTAGKITVKAKINGKHVKASAGAGANVSLTATGDITIDRKVDVSGRSTPGSISIDSGGNIAVNQELRARAKGSHATATGGTITISADGTVTSVKHGKIAVRGKKKVTAAGVLDISGNVGIDLKGRIEARGLYGGSVAATSSAGDVKIEEEVRVYGEFGSGGHAALSAPAGMVFVGGKKGQVRANGGLPGGGGTIILSGATIDVTTLKAKGLHAAGGAITATGGSVSIENMDVSGDSGGFIGVASTVGTVLIDNMINGRAKVTTGAVINVNAATDATIKGPVYIDGKTVGGEGRFAAGGKLALGARENVKFDAGGPTGGVIDGEATGDIDAAGKFSADTGGCIALVAGGVLTVAPGSTFGPPFQMTTCP